MESPPLYKVLFLIARALARSGTPPTLDTGSDRGFTLTGDVTLPAGPLPTPVTGQAIGTLASTENRAVSGHYAETSGTIRANADCTTSVTLNFYQAGRLVRIFYLTGLTGAHGGSQMNCMYPPPHDDDLAEAPS